MFLAVKEMRRAKLRFLLLAGAIALLVFLILGQQALQTGLLTGFVGAIRNQSAPVLVYDVDGQRTIQASAIPADLEAKVRGVDGVARAGRIGQTTVSVATPKGPATSTVLGYDDSGLGAPTTLVRGRLPSAAGEVVASDADAKDGFDVGEAVRVEPGGLVLTVVGLARDARLNVLPTLFTTYATYTDAVAAANPDAGSPLPNVIALEPRAGVTAGELARRVNAVDPEADALTRSRAADLTPGVAQIERSFALIFGLFALVVPFVTGLFFLILTLQKAPALTLLRAIGAPASRLVAALLLQVGAVLTAGIALGVIPYALLTRARVGGLALRFEPRVVAFWSIVFVVLGLASALLAARRVLSIDPVLATTGAGVGR